VDQQLFGNSAGGDGLPDVALPTAPVPVAPPDGSEGVECTGPRIAELAMVVLFGLGSGSCHVQFPCSNLFIAAIDYYTHWEVVANAHSVFYLSVLYWLYLIHSIMGHRACSVFPTPGV
jgi:hypothetical protein